VNIIDKEYINYVIQLEREVKQLREITTQYKKELTEYICNSPAMTWDDYITKNGLKEIPEQTPEWNY
jgi:hypothetical protein